MKAVIVPDAELTAAREKIADNKGLLDFTQKMCDRLAAKDFDWSGEWDWVQCDCGNVIVLQSE